MTIKVSAQQLSTLTASKRTLISFKLIKVEGLVYSEPEVPPAVTIKETNFLSNSIRTRLRAISTPDERVNLSEKKNTF